MSTIKCNIAICLQELGRNSEALEIRREIYAESKANLGLTHNETLRDAHNLASSLLASMRRSLVVEAGPILREVIEAQSPRDKHSYAVMNLRDNYAYAIALMGNVSEAIAMYEDLVRTSQRVFGPAHPFTTIVRNNLRKVRDAKVVYGADPLQG